MDFDLVTCLVSPNVIRKLEHECAYLTVREFEKKVSH